MKPEPNNELEQFRAEHPQIPMSAFKAGSNSGWFRIPTRTIVLSVLSSGICSQAKKDAIAKIPSMTAREISTIFGFQMKKAESIHEKVQEKGVGSLGLWEHVSVSAHRTPTWAEMCGVKDLFWSKDETVIQFHPKASEYVNEHTNCLHLWKMDGHDHELPPEICV